MELHTIQKIDSLMMKIFIMIDNKNISDEEFSKSEEVKNIAFQVVDILKNEGIKTTYDNLTNCNYHTLVKILNYNNFFPESQLSAEYSNELKKINLK